MSHHTREQLHLLNLPREIRNRIYDRLFESAPLTFEIHPESCAGFDKKPPFWVLLPKSTFNIMLTCRTLYHETQERRFSVQWWHFANIGGLEYFNRYATNARKAVVRKISGIQLANYRYKAQLCKLPNLKCVHVGPLRVHHPISYAAVQAVDPTGPERRFSNVGWDELILSVNQAGFEWFAPYGLEPVIDGGRWDEFVLAVDFDVNEYGSSRYWVPTTLNARTKEAVKHWDQMRDSQGGVSWSQLRPTSPSSCVLAQYQSARENPLMLPNRWRRYMTAE